ncbi:uncharacterized protein BDV14DRAFT_172244 [Aspergillus stella-maris]|uniref:uncharacterized protein n=1 Tax=Aspergillus stella-maris TaxID=1810926 RepID=UPI003CCD7407
MLRYCRWSCATGHIATGLNRKISPICIPWSNLLSWLAFSIPFLIVFYIFQCR